MSSELREKYDWIVIGDHPGALLSACLAASLKLSTLVLPLSYTLPRHQTKDGAHSLDFEHNHLIGLGTHPMGQGLIHACLKQVGAPIPSNLIEDLQQVVTPEARVRFSRDATEMIHELSRELGMNARDSGTLAGSWCAAVEGSLASVLDYWLRLPERLTIQKRAVPGGDEGAASSSSSTSSSSSKRGGGKGARPAPVPREGGAPALKGIGATAGRWYSVRERLSGLEERSQLVFQGLWNQIASPGRDEDPTLRDFFTLACLSLTAAGFPGGMTAYRAFLLKVAEKHGAHVRPGLDCTRVFFQRGQFSGVQVAQRGEMTAAVGGAVGCSLEHVRSRVGSSSHSLLSRFKRAETPVGWTFSLSLKLEPAAIPPGFSSPLLWKEPDAPALSIELAEPGKSSLYLRSLMPHTPESLDPAYQRTIAARMVRQAREVLPFLDRNLIDAFPDFREASRWKQAGLYRFESLAEIPDNLKVYGGSGLGAQSGIEGLFCVSEESYPQLGSLGPAVAAVEAVAWIAHRTGLSGPFG
jgi:hypothetical protein